MSEHPSGPDSENITELWKVWTLRY